MNNQHLYLSYGHDTDPLPPDIRQEADRLREERFQRLCDVAKSVPGIQIGDLESLAATFASDASAHHCYAAWFTTFHGVLWRLRFRLEVITRFMERAFRAVDVSEGVTVERVAEIGAEVVALRRAWEG